MDDRQDSSARETARKAASTYEQRFGALIPAVGGIVSQPMVLFDLQGQLGLCEAQLVFLTHVFNRRRDDSLVWVSLADIAAKTGRSLRTVKGWERSLVKLGYIDVRPGRTWRGKQGSNLVDVRPLLARLERLGRAARLERAQSELQLPAPIYDHGEPELVREPPAQRIYAQRTPTGNPVTDRRTPTGNPVTDRANAYRKSGNRSGERLPEIRPPSREDVQRKDYDREERQTGLATAARRPGRERKRERDTGDTPVDDQVLVDGYPTDPGLVSYVEEWAAEFGDDDPARTLATVTHWWRSSGLPPYEAVNAMKQARHEADNRRGRLRRPMAYAMTALHTALCDRCTRLGLPRLPGGPPPLDARDAKVRRADRIRGELEAAGSIENLAPSAQRAFEHLAFELAAIEAELRSDVDVDDDVSAVSA